MGLAMSEIRGVRLKNEPNYGLTPFREVFLIFFEIGGAFSCLGVVKAGVYAGFRAKKY